MFIAHIADDGSIQTCQAHCRGAAERAAAALSSVELEKTGYLAGLLHDAGKFTPEFSNYIRAAVDGHARKGSVIHTFAAVRYLLRAFHGTTDRLTFEDIAAEILAVAVGAHHSCFDLYDENGRGGFQHRLEKQPEYDSRAMAAFFEACAPESEIRALFEQSVREMTAVFDKITAQCRGNWPNTAFMLGLLARLITSAVVEGDRADTAAFMAGADFSSFTRADRALWARCRQSIETRLDAFPADTPIQQARRAFSDACADFAGSEGGIYRLDLPTGGGKTLAGLRYAVCHAEKHNLKRIFYVAPLLTIIEQNAAVIRSALGDSVPVLEHHSNVIRDESRLQSEEEREQFKKSELLEETWDAPVIVTTLVRLLETLFSGSMAAVRRFKSLCGSVILFDEIQSLPINMIGQFNMAINFLSKVCGATVVLCSATQPALSRAERPLLVEKRGIVPDELLRKAAPLFRRTVIADGGICRLEDVKIKAEALLAENGSLLIVCNTKNEASALFDALSDSPVRRFHLSAGMCPAHRRKVLADMTAALESGERLICVSTQVIEAGVDVSFGAVIRFSAGLDSVVQAAGRCNRHGESEAPKPVQILRIADERLGSLREITRAQDALINLLEEYQKNPANFENDLGSLRAVDYYYDCLYAALPKGAQDNAAKDRPTIYDLLAENASWAAQGKDAMRYMLHQAFKSAGDAFEVFDSGTESVLVPYGEGEELIAALNSSAAHDWRYAKELIEKAKAYTVTLYSSQAKHLRSIGAIYDLPNWDINALSAGYYDGETGVITKEEASSCDSPIL